MRSLVFALAVVLGLSLVGTAEAQFGIYIGPPRYYYNPYQVQVYPRPIHPYTQPYGYYGYQVVPYGYHGHRQYSYPNYGYYHGFNGGYHHYHHYR